MLYLIYTIGKLLVQIYIFFHFVFNKDKDLTIAKTIGTNLHAYLFQRVRFQICFSFA